MKLAPSFYFLPPSSFNDTNFRLTPGGNPPIIVDNKDITSGANDIVTGMKYIYNNGIVERVFTDGNRVFSHSHQNLGTVRFKPNGYKTLTTHPEKDLTQVKAFWADGSTSTSRNNVNIKKIDPNSSIQRDLFPDSTQIKRLLGDSIEIRKKGNIKEAGQVLPEGTFIPFLEKNLLTRQITLPPVPEQPKYIRKRLEELLSDATKFSEVAKEILKKMMKK